MISLKIQQITNSSGMVNDRRSTYSFCFLMVICLLGLPVMLVSQSYGKSIEQLSLEFEKSTDDSTRLASLASLSTAYGPSNPDTAIVLGERALEGAIKAKLRIVEANALVSIGEANDISGEYKTAISFIDRGLAIFLELKNKKGLMRAYNSRGSAHYYGGFVELASADYESSLEYAKQDDDLVYQAKLYHNLGMTYAAHSEYVESLNAYLSARNLKDSLVRQKVEGINARDQFSTYNNLGALYDELLQLDKARESYNEALKYAEDIALRRFVILYNLGTVEERDSNYVDAETYFQQSLKIAETNNFIGRQALTLNGLGGLYRDRNIFERAQTYYSQSLEILKEYPNPISEGIVLNDQGILFVKQQRFEEAKINGLEALQLGEATEDQITIVEAHDLLAKAAEGQGELEQAAIHLRQYVDLKEVLDKDETKRSLIGLHAVMDVKLAEERHKGELSDQKLKYEENKSRILLITSILILGLAIALAVALRKVSKINVQLVKANADLEDRNLELATANQKLGFANNKLQQFAFATGHDLKESLRNITSFTQLASIQMAEDVTSAQQHLTQAAAGGKRMRKMLDDLLHFTNIGGDDSVVVAFPLFEVIGSVKQQLKGDIEKTRGDIHQTTAATFKADRMAIEQLFYNLSHNALRYIKPDEAPRISINAEKRGEEIVFLVKDNGMGVVPEHRENIFKPFYRLHDRMQSGSGLGLSICKRVVESYDGKIWYEPNEEGGSIFCFTIPGAQPKIQV